MAVLIGNRPSHIQSAMPVHKLQDKLALPGRRNKVSFRVKRARRKGCADALDSGGAT